MFNTDLFEPSQLTQKKYKYVPKVSIDYDGTLSLVEIQEFVLYLQENYEVELYITTRRYEIEGEEVIQTAYALDIPENNITFCDRNFKYEYLIDNNIDIHIDDDYAEVLQIPLGKKVNILCIYQPKWDEEFFSYLNNL